MKLGIIGTNWITNDFISAVEEVGKWEFAAVYSRSMEKAKCFGEPYGIKIYYNDLEVFANEAKVDIDIDIDIIYIASPNSLHVPQVKLFLKNKKHVICEKPLAASYNDMYELFEIAEKNNVFLFEAFRHIHSPGFFELRANLENIQPIRNCYLSYNQFSSRYPAFLRGENPNVFNPDMDGGAFLDIGIYPVSLAIALFGEPVDVLSSFIPLSNEADGTGAVILKYSGFIVTISFAKTCQDYIENQFAGENGTIVIDKAPELSKITVYDTTGNCSELYIKNNYKHKMTGEAAVFASIIENNDFAEYEKLKKISLQTCKLMEKIRASH